MNKFKFKAIAALMLAAVCCLSFAGCDDDASEKPGDSGSESTKDNSKETGNESDTTVKELSLNEDDLYMIYTAEDLVLYRDMFDKAAQEFNDANGPSGVFLFPGLILMDDIDLSSICSAEIGSWKPIGADAYHDKSGEKYYDEYFTSTFDGNGKTISGLYVNDPENGGALLYGIWEETVQDLTIADSTILSVKGEGGGTNYCAAIAIHARDGLIENCVIEDSVTIEGDSAAAGFIAKAEDWNRSCAVRYCKNYANIKTSGVAGGIVASASSKVYIIGCENHGDITSFGDGASCLGGIIGIHSGSPSYAGRIYGCINYGDVTETINGKNRNVAGIAGSSSTTIRYCANAGNITGIRYAYDIACHDEGSDAYNANYGTVTSELDPEYAITAVYKGCSYQGINYPLGTSALTDGTALAEIIDKAGEFWKQGEQFPVWNGEFQEDFPSYSTKGAIVEE